jgi:hypothetical protein
MDMPFLRMQPPYHMSQSGNHAAIRIQVAPSGLHFIRCIADLVFAPLCDQFIRSASTRFSTALSTHACCKSYAVSKKLSCCSVFSLVPPRIVLRVFSLKLPRCFLAALKSCGHIQLQVRESKMLVRRLSSGKDAKQSACMAWRPKVGRLAGSRNRSVNSSSQGYGYGKAKHRKASSSCLGKREASFLASLSDTAEASDFSRPSTLIPPRV